jgi:hypothetical protein
MFEPVNTFGEGLFLNIGVKGHARLTITVLTLLFSHAFTTRIADGLLFQTPHHHHELLSRTQQ